MPFSPVQRARKFSAVLGTTSARSCGVVGREGQRSRTRGDFDTPTNQTPTSISTRPAALPPISMSKNTIGFGMSSSGSLSVYCCCARRACVGRGAGDREVRDQIAPLALAASDFFIVRRSPRIPRRRSRGVCGRVALPFLTCDAGDVRFLALSCASARVASKILFGLGAASQRHLRWKFPPAMAHMLGALLSAKAHRRWRTHTRAHTHTYTHRERGGERERTGRPPRATAPRDDGVRRLCGGGGG